ncbi:MAG: hemerythrin family protein [Desulfobacteraceae bacterium]|nr:hemerythrin family protein [Desulfobacteraceae bacterium]
MALINWNDSLSVNVAEIDLQHQKLISMINDLHDAMKIRKAKEVLGKIIDELLDYTVTHFSVEEKYFAQFNYPETASHKKEHTAFVDKIKDVKKGFDEERLMISMDIMNFLKSWLENHIKGTDKKYSSLFNAKGLN